MKKKNPFYGISVLAMLFGCYLINHALRLEPGHVEKLVVLIGVLQVYEALLIGLGVALVFTRKAPRDGVTVLLLETLFLLDATFLATECVVADAGVGTPVALVLAALAVGKLTLVRRIAPDALSRPVAVVLGLHAVLVFTLPIAVAQLASARVLAPVSLHALWWVTLALPLAQRLVQQNLASTQGPRALRALVGWTWLPALSVLAHLAALGWIHQIPFHPAFAAPFVLGLALVSSRRQVARQILLPACAVLLTLGQSETLGFPLLATGGPWISPLRLAALTAAATYAILARRYGYRWLLALAAPFGGAGLMGSNVGDVFIQAPRLLPHDALSWGITGVVGAFVFLALGVRQSLHEVRIPPGGRDLSSRGHVAAALFFAALSAASVLWAVSSLPHGHPSRRPPAFVAMGLGVAALAAGARALSRISGAPGNGAEGRAATTAVLAATVGLSASVPLFAAAPSYHPSGIESAVIDEIGTLISGQAAYARQNDGYAAASLLCLTEPAGCLPGYGTEAPRFIPRHLMLPYRSSYRWSFHPGPRLGGPPGGPSPTGVETWAYVAVPQDPGRTGSAAFCGDSTGRTFVTLDGTPPPLSSDSTCDPNRAYPLP